MYFFKICAGKKFEKKLTNFQPFIDIIQSIPLFFDFMVTLYLSAKI